MKHVIGQELEKVDFVYLKEIVSKVSEFFQNNGILIEKSFDTVQQNNDGELQCGKIDGNWLQTFVIIDAKPAFYKQINNVDDLEKSIENFNQALDSLHTTISNFAEQNAALGEDMRKKITRLNAGVTRAKKALTVRGKNLLKECKENCETINEMQNLTARMFAKMLQEKLLEAILLPLYEGLAVNNEAAYIFVLKQINALLGEWGIKTLDINQGDKFDYEMMPYEPTSDSQENITNDKSLRDAVKEVRRYAYVFNEDDEKCLPVWNGSVSVWRYEG